MANVRFKGNLSFINNPLPKEKQRVGSRQGALIRTIARRSIRRVNKRGTPAKPGTPPRSRKGLLKNFIFYSWDSSEQAVVAGPEKLLLPGQTPKVLEYGGTNRTKKGRATYKARPFMRPALGTAMAKLPELWDGAMK